MKRKIISVLLILMFLIMSLPITNISVEAKMLIDYEDDWCSYWDENWIEVETEYVIEYATLDDYLNEHYKGYVNVDKDKITRLFIEGFSTYDIKDLSGLYDFPNLTELEIYYPVSQDAIKALDFTRLTNLKKLNIYGVDLSNIELDKLTNLTYLSIGGSDINFNSTLNLNNMKNLRHFECWLDITEEIFVAKTVEDIKNKITPLDGYEICATFEFFGAGQSGSAEFMLVEELNVNISTDKTTYNLGDKVTATVNWDKGMQAADFEIKFDAAKLKLENASIGKDYYNLVENGKILVSWVSLLETDIQEISFEFSTVGNGQAEIILLPENFADGNIDSDFIVDESKHSTIMIGKSTYIKENSSIETNIINNEDIITGLNLNNNKVTLEDFLAEENFVSNLEVKVFNNKDEEITDTSKGLGTGYKVRLYENNKMVKEYSVVVYGDTTGDGEITAFDALTLIKVINKKIEFTDKIYYEAGRIITAEGNEPSAIDALAIIKHLNKKYTINQ